jgi:hypothetical protein
MNGDGFIDIYRRFMFIVDSVHESGINFRSDTDVDRFVCAVVALAKVLC